MLKNTPSPALTPDRSEKWEKYGPLSELLNASTNDTQSPVTQIAPKVGATTHGSMPARTYWSLPVDKYSGSEPFDSWMYSDGNRMLELQSGTVRVAAMKRKFRP